MLHHTKKIRKIYENIQTKIYYMIPEKWNQLYLYASVIDKENGEQSGELYFYYIPKGILKKKPVNVYEIPNKFNLDENEYMQFVKIIYEQIKNLRNEFKETGLDPLWSNLTMSIEDLNFKVEYNYNDLLSSPFDSYERHIIWRYQYLNIGPEQVNNKDRQIINRYIAQVQANKTTLKTDIYEDKIYIRDVGNMVAYNTTEENEAMKNVEKQEVVEIKEEIKPKKKKKNQILLSEDELKKMKEQ